MLAFFSRQDVKGPLPLGESLIARDRVGEREEERSSLSELSSTIGVRILSGWMLIKAAVAIEVNNSVVNIRRINVKFRNKDFMQCLTWRSS